MDIIISDDASPSGTPLQQPDPQGQAAILLVESLIHGLIAKEAITTEEAVEIIDIAAEVKEQIGELAHENVAILEHSLRILKAMSGSLRHDIGA